MIHKNKKAASRGRQPDGQPNAIDIHVGSRIRMRRNLLGFSQEVTANRLGLTFQQLQKYERGINRVSGSRLYDIGQILGVSVDWFFEEMDEETSKRSPRSFTADSQSLTEAVVNPLNREEAIKLVTAYNKINNRKISQAIYKLIMNMAYPNAEDK